MVWYPFIVQHWMALREAPIVLLCMYDDMPLHRFHFYFYLLLSILDINSTVI